MAVTAIRTVILYLVLAAAMRVMGKRQLGDLQPVELVVTLLIADMAAAATGDPGMPLFAGLIPLFLLVALELLVSGAMLKWPGLARLIGGRPVVLIKKGRLDQKAMKQLRLTLEDLAGALREQGVFDISQVECALVETGGKISLQLKPPHRPATAAQVGGAAKKEGLPFLVVSDGRISPWGLSMIGRDEAWLAGVLQKEECPLDRVFLLTADGQGSHYLIRKETDK